MEGKYLPAFAGDTPSTTGSEDALRLLNIESAVFFCSIASEIEKNQVMDRFFVPLSRATSGGSMISPKKPSHLMHFSFQSQRLRGTWPFLG